MEKEIIGTDSIDTCEKEGYLMMETEGEFDKSKGYRVFAYYPEYLEKEGISGLQVDTWVSWDGMKEVYKKHKKDLDKFADDLPYITRKRKPSFHDLLWLTDSISAYRGLE